MRYCANIREFEPDGLVRRFVEITFIYEKSGARAACHRQTFSGAFLLAEAEPSAFRIADDIGADDFSTIAICRFGFAVCTKRGLISLIEPLIPNGRFAVGTDSHAERRLAIRRVEAGLLHRADTAFGFRLCLFRFVQTLDKRGAILVGRLLLRMGDAGAGVSEDQTADEQMA